jgi:hypothetical protein
MSTQPTQLLLLHRFVWIAGFVTIALSLVMMRTKRWSSLESTTSRQDAIVNRAVESTATTNRYIRKHTQSMGDLGRDGVILNSYEYPSGVVSNVFVLSSGNVVTQVIALPASDRWIGTKEYEEIADRDFQRNLSKDPALAELKKIFEEFSAAKDSHYFYSGLRQLIVARSEILGVRRRRRAFEASGGDGVTFRPQYRYLTDEDWSRAYFRDRLEQQSLESRCRERLTQLYGQMPEEMFQRLMSVKVLMVPDPLPDLDDPNSMAERIRR